MDLRSILRTMTPVEEKLSSAVNAGRASEVSSLLRDHPRINVTVSGKWSPLHSACWKGHVEVVKLFLALPNINVNLTDGDGQTPLSISCWKAACLLFESY